MLNFFKNIFQYFFKDSFYEPDYFNEEEENRYLAEHNSPDNNNYMSPTYASHTDDYMSLSHDNNNDTYGTYSDSKSQRHNNSSKLNRNDSNNNANGFYNYQRTSCDDQMNDKTKLGLSNDSEEYYEMYEDEAQKDDRRYEEEFDNEYAQDSSTLSKQMMHKQMSILEDDAQQLDEYMNEKDSMMLDGEQKAIDEEYLDEFDEDAIPRRTSRTSDSGGYMKKQESIMEDDPELKHFEDSMKNQQQQFQDIDKDHFGLDITQKSVSITEDGVTRVVHEKPQPKRTAKQRWHWAYNRIVHQAQVSELNLH